MVRFFGSGHGVIDFFLFRIIGKALKKPQKSYFQNNVSLSRVFLDLYWTFFFTETFSKVVMAKVPFFFSRKSLIFAKLLESSSD